MRRWAVLFTLRLVTVSLRRGGVNESVLHWDMVCDLRTGSGIRVDGELFSKNGEFVFSHKNIGKQRRPAASAFLCLFLAKTQCVALRA